MEIKITYAENKQLWEIERIAKENGYTKTDDCYWTQIFRNENGDEIVTIREDNVDDDPVETLKNAISNAEETFAVRVKVYDGSKYESGSKKIADVDYMVNSFCVRKIHQEEILKEFGETDEYNEYLILTFPDGDTSTFRNSHADIFILR